MRLYKHQSFANCRSNPRTDVFHASFKLRFPFPITLFYPLDISPTYIIYDVPSAPAVHSLV